MLVLTRHKGESVMVGDKVEITIASVRNNKVRLGVTAPRGISVHRKEIYEIIQRKGRKKVETI